MLNPYEQFAVGFFLATYPKDATYEEICNLIADESNKIVVWEAFDHFRLSELIEEIDGMVINLNKNFVPRS